MRTVLVPVKLKLKLTIILQDNLHTGIVKTNIIIVTLTISQTTESNGLYISSFDSGVSHEAASHNQESVIRYIITD